MDNDLRHLTQCDGCGTNMTKAHRRHKDQKFCSNCYPRYFVSRACPKCSQPSRLFKSDTAALCRKCENSGPCVRCGKSEYKLGKLTPYGPACNSCSKYFRQPKPTPAVDDNEVSGSASSTAVSKSDSMRGTCTSCRRHRKLNGKLCFTCLERGHIPCPICTELMPAGRGNACESCYWLGTYKKRVKMNLAGLGSKAVAGAFEAFSDWLITHVSAKRAALSIDRYLHFFVQIQKHWNGLPSYESLVDKFSAEGLRRFRLPMKWASETGVFLVDAEMREASSERRRIDALLAEVAADDRSAIVGAYLKYLKDREVNGETSLRSIRLALRPAVSLMIEQANGDKAIPSQSSLDAFLVKSPGQKAAIWGFISFLNANYETDLVPRVDPIQTRARRHKQKEEQLIELLGEPVKGKRPAHPPMNG
ncbi:hypothetical protein SAMN05192549_1272 [Duganella sacchari]|uniref:Uncharacterized protein n=2 Tax=Duganella sacchari TaxID=551987 RepID=A0A1M7REU5_9BURK|nr:hypothetical protein SAMN05192549_1272 [Duganella sacchari]